MKILFLGDIVGRDGRNIVFEYLEKLRLDNGIDLTIVNGENSAHGKGISYKIYEQFIEHGVDVITMGNHTYSKKDIVDHLTLMPKMIQPYNHILQYHQGYLLLNCQGLEVCVTNILGSAFMHDNAMSAFKAMDEVLSKTKSDIYFVDLHAETTAEKLLFANYYKELGGAIVGTHTHVQTADERILGNLAYISDVGMCGVYDSIIGRDIDEMIDNIVYGNKTHYTIAKGPAILNGVIIEIDVKDKKAVSIQRISLRPY